MWSRTCPSGRVAGPPCSSLSRRFLRFRIKDLESRLHSEQLSRKKEEAVFRRK